MDKKEYALSFIDRINKEESDGLFKFFTRNTVIVFLEDFKEISVPDFVAYCKENYLNKDIKIKRVLESKVCVKIEFYLEQKENSFLIEVKERRIKRLEIMNA